MRSRTSFFNPALFKKTVVRFWPVWFLYAFIWLLLLPGGMSGELARSLRMENAAYASMRILMGTPLEAAVSPYVPLLALAFSCASAMAVFSHLYFPRSAAAYGALPVRRETAFLSLSLAGLLPLLAANVIVAAAVLAVEALCGKLLLWPVMTWLGVVSLECLTFFGICAFCAQLTGSMIVMPVLAIVVNAAAWFVEGVVTALLTTFVFGYTYSGRNVVSLLSPIEGLQRLLVASAQYEEDAEGISRLVGYEFSGWGAALIYGAVGLAFLVFALLLYRRRRLETAGDVVAVGCLKPVFKYLLSLGGALCLGYLLFGITSGSVRYGTGIYALELALFMCVGAFIGYFAAEMLIKKSFAVFRGAKRYIGFGIVCLCSMLFVVFCETGFFGYETRLPTREDVASVSLEVYRGGKPSAFTADEDIDAAMALHEDIIAHKSVHESQANAYTTGMQPLDSAAPLFASSADLYVAAEQAADDYSDPDCYAVVKVEYTLTSGDKLTRRYELMGRDTTGDIRALQNLVNTKPGIATRNETDFPVTLENILYAGVNSGYYPLGGGEDYSVELTESEAHELYYDCMLPDMADGTLGLVYLIEDNGYYDTEYDCTIYIDCYERLRTPGAGERYQSLYVNVSAAAERTCEWLAQHGIHPLTIREAVAAAEAEAR